MDLYQHLVVLRVWSRNFSRDQTLRSSFPFEVNRLHGRAVLALDVRPDTGAEGPRLRPRHSWHHCFRINHAQILKLLSDSVNSSTRLSVINSFELREGRVLELDNPTLL